MTNKKHAHKKAKTKFITENVGLSIGVIVFIVSLLSLYAIPRIANKLSSLHSPSNNRTMKNNVPVIGPVGISPFPTGTTCATSKATGASTTSIFPTDHLTSDGSTDNQREIQTATKKAILYFTYYVKTQDRSLDFNYIGFILFIECDLVLCFYFL